MAEQAKVGDTVSVHYTGALEDGSVFDSSEGNEPLKFTIGSGTVIPGFEKAVVGMSEGQEKIEKIPSKEAYGPRRSEMFLKLERRQLPEELDAQVGQELELTDDQGHTEIATVIEVSPDAITLDANHMLAGKDLVFTIKLEKIYN